MIEMSENNVDEIRSRITRRYENRTQFLGHLAAFIVLNALLWTEVIGIKQGWLLTGFSGLWFMGLVIHFVNFLMTEARERAIERAVEQERAWVRGLEDGEKPKRDRRARLSTDDGELLDVVDDEWEGNTQRHSVS